MKTHALLAAALFALPAPPAAAQTVLQLAVTGAATALPDQMAAALTVQASAATAASAQAAVNRAMTRALAAAKAVAGVDATTGSYGVSQIQPGPGQEAGFQASQELNLTMPAPGGAPAASFTALIGRLQAAGLLLDSLNGQLSDSGQDAVRRAAVADALRRLQSDAANIAAALGDQVGGIKSLNVQLSGGGPVQPRMMLMAAAAPPPSAAPGPVTLSADVSAEIELTRKP